MDKKIPRSLAATIIDEFVYNQRNREVLKRRLLDGVKYEDLSEEFDLSVRQVKQIVKDGKEDLKHLM